MSAPKKKAAPAFKQLPPRTSVHVSCGPGEDQRPKLAELIAAPEMAALRVVRAAEGDKGFGADLDMPSLLDRLRTQASAVNSGEMQQVEAMLMNQATALQSLFARLVEYGMRSELLSHLDAYLRLGLRAQAQCSRTLEALAAIKNPPVVFAKNANIAHQQQVNNGVVAGGFSPARESEIPPSKLLECVPDERLDFGTPATAGGIDPQLATLEPVNRPQVVRG